jgi:hypothetical protein
MNRMTVNEDVRDATHAMGLLSFADFMAGPAGELLDSEKGGRQLRLLQTKHQGEMQRFFLKRLGREPFTKLVQMLLFGRWPSSGPIRELHMLNRLNEAGFATMRPVAFGERRFFGWPLGGFLLVEEVRGKEVADFHALCPPPVRRNLFHALGGYLGRLHAAGFYQPVRLKDLFLSNDPGREDEAYAFVLIDRETCKPWPAKFSRRRALQALARATRRTLRDGHTIGHREILSFCQGYHREMGTALGMSAKTLIMELMRSLREEFRKKTRKSTR